MEDAKVARQDSMGICVRKRAHQGVLNVCKSLVPVVANAWKVTLELTVNVSKHFSALYNHVCVT